MYELKGASIVSIVTSEHSKLVISMQTGHKLSSVRKQAKSHTSAYNGYWSRLIFGDKPLDCTSETQICWWTIPVRTHTKPRLLLISSRTKAKMVKLL